MYLSVCRCGLDVDACASASPVRLSDCGFTIETHVQLRVVFLRPGSRTKQSEPFPFPFPFPFVVVGIGFCVPYLHPIPVVLHDVVGLVIVIAEVLSPSIRFFHFSCFLFGSS